MEFDVILNLTQFHKSLGSCISLPASSKVGKLFVIICFHLPIKKFSFQKPAPLPLDSISSSSRNIAEWSVLIEGMISTLVTKIQKVNNAPR